ncbi:MAG: ribosome maturation factor RimM [Actinomycetota bacterium]|nr:ribosome maturation factor RimM [Actinomycetota bacterium]
MSLRIIGIIGKPHGVKGYITLRLYTDYPKSIKEGEILSVSKTGSKTLTVGSIKAGGRSDCLLVKFLELDSRDAAESYRGCPLYRLDQHKHQLDPGSYWADDLPGCKIYFKKKYVGMVAEAWDMPANYVLSVDIDNEDLQKKLGGNILIPFTETYIDEVDSNRGIITLKLLPEYI